MLKRLFILVAFASLAASAAAQTTFFSVRIENASQPVPYIASGSFAVPVGADAPAPIGPGGAYEFEFDAPPGSRLSLVTMFVQSNDWFYAPAEEGIPLWDDAGMPVGGDVTDQFMLWNAGTEVDEEPGVGSNQAPRQSGPDTGDDENGSVGLVGTEYDVPAAEDVIQVTITSTAETRFTVRVENVSDSETLTTSTGESHAVPLSPGVWVVHTDAGPLFTSDEPASAGLEDIAEDGDPALLGSALAEMTGVNVVISPGVWAVHSDDAPLFSSGEADRGLGLESIAEDGNPSALAQHLAEAATVTGGAFAVPFDSPNGMGAPAGPGSGYEFTISAKPGARLSLATMFVQSNDWFYAPDESGIALWDENGMPVDGDVTDKLMLWNAGTEVDQIPGVGIDQAPRQSAADTGEPEDGVVRLVSGTQPIPDVTEALRVTVTPLETIPFTVRIRNVSDGETLTTSSGESHPVPVSPGVWVVHGASTPLFSEDVVDRGMGLEAIAEDGDPTPLATALDDKAGLASGAFAVPVGGDGPAPIGPGGEYEITFDAAPGTRLSLATMFVQSNDLFYAPGEDGIALWDAEGRPLTGDITEYFQLWDAGTEVNQEPGVGDAQAPRQSGPDTGTAESRPVRLVDDGYDYPSAADVIEVTIQSVATSAEESPEIPAGFALEQNYPNPFNPTTTIRFELEAGRHVRLEIFDLTGRKVATLIDNVRAAGEHRAQWDGRLAAGVEAPSGVYLYRLSSGAETITRTMVLLR